MEPQLTPDMSTATKASTTDSSSRLKPLCCRIDADAEEMGVDVMVFKKRGGAKGRSRTVGFKEGLRPAVGLRWGT
jgi:hypothetical protein